MTTYAHAVTIVDHLPTGGTDGQVLRLTGGAATWDDPIQVSPTNTVAGAGAPAAGDGDDGFFYLQIDAAAGTNNWWGPKAGGAWPAQADYKTSDAETASAVDFTGAEKGIGKNWKGEDLETRITTGDAANTAALTAHAATPHVTAGLLGQITTNQTDIATEKARTDAQQTAITTNTTNIGTEAGRNTTQDGLIAANTAHAADTTKHVPAPGTDGQVLKLVSGVATWVDPVEVSPNNAIAGAGAPAAAVGTDDDFYLQVDAAAGENNWWGPKAGGAWPAQADFKTSDPLTGAIGDFGHVTEGPKAKSFSADTIDARISQRAVKNSFAGAGANINLSDTTLRDGQTWVIRHGGATGSAAATINHGGLTGVTQQNLSVPGANSALSGATSFTIEGGETAITSRFGTVVVVTKIPGITQPPKNPLLEPAGDFLALPVNDGGAGDDGAIYRFDPTANVSLPAIATMDTASGVSGCRVSCDWAARAAIGTPPDWITNGADVLNVPNGWPATGNEFVDIIVSGGQWLALT